MSNNSEPLDEQARIDALFFELQEVASSSDFGRLAVIINHPRLVHVSEGRYPKTIEISDGLDSITLGYKKLNLILDSVFDLAFFAVFRYVRLPKIRSYSRGEVIICLPSKESAKVFLSRKFAKLLCAGMGRISQYLD